MNLPRITIVTPCFNGQVYISKTIESVLNQNYPYLEYIIFDPGSTDKSREIISNYARKYKQIKTVFKKDLGQWDAVNRGFHQSEGELLGYINCDDIYEKNALLRVAEAYQKQPDRLWYVGFGRMINDVGEITQEFFSWYKNLLLLINNQSLLYIVNYLMQPSVFITKKAFTQIGNFIGREKYIMEYDSWLRLSNIDMPQIIPKTLSYFRLTSTGASMQYYQKILEADMSITQKYTNNWTTLFLHKAHNQVRRYIASGK